MPVWHYVDSVVSICIFYCCCVGIFFFFSPSSQYTSIRGEYIHGTECIWWIFNVFIVHVYINMRHNNSYRSIGMCCSYSYINPILIHISFPSIRVNYIHWVDLGVDFRLRSLLNGIDDISIRHHQFLPFEKCQYYTQTHRNLHKIVKATKIPYILLSKSKNSMRRIHNIYSIDLFVGALLYTVICISVTSSSHL